MAALDGYGFNYTRKISGASPFGTIGNDLDDSVYCENSVGGKNVKIAAGATVHLPWAWTRSLTKVLEYTAKVDPGFTIGNLTPSNLVLMSNDANSPDDSETLVLGAGYHWFRGVDPDANMPFPTADVTDIFAHNPGGVDIVLTFAAAGDHP